MGEAATGQDAAGGGRRVRRPYGTPLGGLGTGHVELGPDGWFRNVSIGGGGAPGAGLRVLEHSFLALRVASESGGYCRRLQTPRHAHRAAGEAERFLRADALHWRGLYPAARYRLEDPACPVAAEWDFFAPVTPYDADASSMPAVFAVVRVSNAQAVPVEVSVLLSWENLLGRTSRIAAAQAEEEETYRSAPNPRLTPEAAPQPEPEAPPPNALLFGGADAAVEGGGGQHCVAVRMRAGARVAVGTWEPGDAEGAARFWADFAAGIAPAAGRERGAGALMATWTIGPGQARRAQFVIAWHAPRGASDGTDAGHAYALRAAGALDTARNALKFHGHHAAAIDNWQRGILSATLPGWMRAALLNHLSAFSTNTRYDAGRRFALAEHGGAGAAPVNDLRLYASTAVLRFFPRLEEQECARQTAALEEAAPGLFAAAAGGDAPPPAAEIEGALAVVLSACRNYWMMDNRARLTESLPRIERVLMAVAALDRDGDLLPEWTAPSATFDGIAIEGVSSALCSLWIASLRAFVAVLGQLGRTQEAAAIDRRAVQAAQRFDALFWLEEAGHYALWADPARPREAWPASARVCHCTQLLGQWWADQMGLGPLFDRARIERALDAMSALLADERGLRSAAWPAESGGAAPGLLWPARTTPVVAALLFQHGRAQRAMQVLQRYDQWAAAECGGAAGVPACWDAGRGAPAADGMRSAAMLSFWPLLDAIAGVVYCAPQRRLRIMPNVPPGTAQVHLPLFMPGGLGALSCREDPGDPYWQRVKARFDSPVEIQWIELRLPSTVTACEVSCSTAEAGHFKAACSLIREGDAQRLVIRPETALPATQELHVTAAARTGIQGQTTNSGGR